jgi:hypothetical protein
VIVLPRLAKYGRYFRDDEMLDGWRLGRLRRRHARRHLVRLGIWMLGLAAAGWGLGMLSSSFVF